MGYTPPFLDVRKVAGAYNVYAPSSTTGDDLAIYPNTTDTLPYILLLGNSSVYIYAKSGATHNFLINGQTIFKISQSGTDSIWSSDKANDDIYIQPNGTGVLKFGTYTAGAATDSTGYITIKDAAGNTRKLMVQA